MPREVRPLQPADPKSHDEPGPRKPTVSGELRRCSAVQLLPHGSAWIPLVVDDGEELRVSQSDMSAAFYLFEAWQRFMAFNVEFPREASVKQLGRCGALAAASCL